jgi:hypothetical protein
VDEKPVEDLPQIVEEMPTVGHVEDARRAQSYAFRIRATPIPTHHLDAGVAL